MNLEQKGGALNGFEKSIIALTIMLSLLITTNVKGATLTDAEYARLRLVFSDLRIATMSDEKAQEYLSYDLEHNKKVSKYFKVTKTTNGTTSTEVTKEEATNAAKNNTTTRAASHATTYKNIQISSMNGGTNAYIIDVTTVWLISPAIKSYDVTAMRTDDATIIEGTQEGTQGYIYKMVILGM